MDRREPFPVTDDLLDAPDGAVVDGFERVGDWWHPVKACDCGTPYRFDEFTGQAKPCVSCYEIDVPEGAEGDDA